MKTLVIIPTVDEAGNITAILDAVLREAPLVDVLVVDDDSPDGTARLVAAHPAFGNRVFLLNRHVKEGLGAAYRAGFAWGLRRDYDAIVEMDADFSHPPERLPALIAALDSADVAVGSRYTSGGGVRDWPLLRRAVSRAGNAYVRLVLDLAVHDATAGFKAFRREALQDIRAVDSQSEGYCFQIETTWRADRVGLKLVEVPIIFTDRTEGQSKMSGVIVREAMLQVLGWRWSQLTGRSPIATGVVRQRRSGHRDVVGREPAGLLVSEASPAGSAPEQAPPPPGPRSRRPQP